MCDDCYPESERETMRRYREMTALAYRRAADGSVWRRVSAAIAESRMARKARAVEARFTNDDRRADVWQSSKRSARVMRRLS